MKKQKEQDCILGKNIIPEDNTGKGPDDYWSSSKCFAKEANSFLLLSAVFSEGVGAVLLCETIVCIFSLAISSGNLDLVRLCLLW